MELPRQKGVPFVVGFMSICRGVNGTGISSLITYHNDYDLVAKSVEHARFHGSQVPLSVQRSVSSCGSGLVKREFIEPIGPSLTTGFNHAEQL